MRSACTALLIIFAVALTGCYDATVQLLTPTGFPQSATPAQLASGETLLSAMLEKRQIVLEWPLKIRKKDSALIELAIAMDEQGRLTATAAAPGQSPVKIPVNVSDLYATHNIVAVARLDMAGVESFREEMREPLQPGREVVFRWNIRADAAGVYRGVVWLHLDLVPKNGEAVERVLLLARTIEVEAVTVFGLSGSAARYLGLFGLAASAGLGYPFILDCLKSKRDQPQKIRFGERAAR